MPRYVCVRPDGKYQVFSTVCDGFVSGPMDDDELRAYRRREYGASSERDTELFLKTGRGLNVMDYEEAFEIDQRTFEEGIE